MEVREIVETIVKEPLIEVRFRLEEDGDDVIRIYEFDLSEISEYGYMVLTEDFDVFDFSDDDDWDDEDSTNDELFVDEDELISFMNEYFMINDKIPPAELF
jgi:hypothetical protein